MDLPRASDSFARLDTSYIWPGGPITGPLSSSLSLSCVITAAGAVKMEEQITLEEVTRNESPGQMCQREKIR